MTKYSNLHIMNIASEGDASMSRVNYSNADSEYGVRPSFYLKSTAKIGDVDGNGTQDYFYEIVCTTCS